jgi:hypothetical protein
MFNPSKPVLIMQESLLLSDLDSILFNNFINDNMKVFVVLLMLKTVGKEF